MDKHNRNLNSNHYEFVFQNTQQIIDLNNLLQEKEKELHGRDERFVDMTVVSASLANQEEI
jgi:hypothetical protein